MRRISSPRLARLLPIAVPAAVVALFLAAEAPSLIGPDAWLALVAGREIAAHGLPSTDHLTVFAAGRSWVDQQWLAHVLFFRADRWLGAWAVTALSLLSYLSAFTVAAGIACSRAARGWSVGVFFVAAVASSPWAMGTGPQSLALLLFALMLVLILRDPDGKRQTTLWLLPLLCLWGNLHGSAALGALLACLFGLQASIRRRGSMPIALAGLLAPLTLLISPYALDLPGYYRLMLINPPFAGHVELWQRTRPDVLTAVFFVLAAAGAVLVMRRRRALAAIDFIVLLATLAAALDAVRGIVWFALAALATLPALAHRPLEAAKGTAANPGRRPIAAIAAPALIAASAVAVIWGASRPPVFYDPSFPAAFRAILQTKPNDERVFVDGRYADWLLWKLPSLRGRVAYDARVELLTSAQIIEQERFTKMWPGWTTPVERFGLVVSDRKHVTVLVAKGGWRRLYSRGHVAVAERA